MSEDADREEFVRAAARRLGLELSPEQVARVAAAFARNAEQAALIMDFELGEAVDAAAVFRP
jgi:hypothetical protein